MITNRDENGRILSRPSLCGGREDEIIGRYLTEDISLNQLGREYNTTRQSVAYLLKKRGIPIQPRKDGCTLKRGKPLTQEEIGLMVECYSEGFTQGQVARLFEVSIKVVQNKLKSAGVGLRSDKLSGEHHPRWNGGKCETGSGYINIWIEDDHPMACMRMQTGYVSEHRLIVAESVGRPLTDDETVHHINGIRNDNRRENLQLRTESHGSGQVRRCGDCGSHNIICEEL